MLPPASSRIVSRVRTRPAILPEEKVIIRRRWHRLELCIQLRQRRAVKTETTWDSPWQRLARVDIKAPCRRASGGGSIIDYHACPGIGIGRTTGAHCAVAICRSAAAIRVFQDK